MKILIDNGHRLRTDYTDGDPDMEADFYILRHTTAPAVLTENFFMDSHPDCAFRRKDQCQNGTVRNKRLTNPFPIHHTGEGRNDGGVCSQFITKGPIGNLYLLIDIVVQHCPPCPLRPPVDKVDSFMTSSISADVPTSRQGPSP